MASATRILRERVVLVFDFDDTLAPSTTPVLAEALGLDADAISRQLDEMQADGWQYAIAKAEVFRQRGRGGAEVTEDRMRALGEEYDCFPGVGDFVQRLREFGRSIDDAVALEFVMLTAGFGTIPRATPIGKQFDRVYAGELNFDDDGYVIGAKRVITHADKVLYIKQLAQGREFTEPSDLEDTAVYRDPDDYYVPLSQVVYVGDGASDMSAFQLVTENGGFGIAINKDGGTWEERGDVSEDRRVHNVAPPEYTEGSELMTSLEAAVASSIYRIKLTRKGQGE